MRQSTPDILDNILTTAPPTFSQENDRGALVWLPVGRIYGNPFQPRTNYDDVDSLAESIWALRDELPATLGLQQPPVARVIVFGDDGDETAVERSRYNDPAALRRLALSDKHAVQLHFGHRRLRAWKLLRDRDPAYAEFPVLLAYADDLGMWKHVVSENAQRKDINAIEEAETLRVAVDRFNLTLEQAGQPFGYSKSTISNKLRLLNLPEELRLELQAGRMTERHGRALLRLAPAPHLWSRFTRTTMLDMSVADLEKQVEELIANCEPLPPAKATGYKYLRKTYSGNEIRSEKYDPPVWPYDWTPAPYQGVRGACVGCEFRATFGGDAGARCTHPDQRCMDAKLKRWNVEQAQRQQAALQQSASTGSASSPAANSAGAAPAAPPITLPDKKLVDYTEEDWAQAKAAAAQSRATTPPAAPAAPAQPSAPIHTDLRTIDVEWFTTRGWSAAPAALLDKGLCTAERCKCLVLAYHPKPEAHHVRPDAEHAPNMCYGCTSTQRLANRKQELEHGDVAALRKRVKAEQEEAERLLTAAFATYSADELWHNRMFILGVIEGADIPQRYKAKEFDLATMQSMIFFGVAAATCKRWDGSTQKWDLAKVQAWLAELAAAAGRVEPEIGMVVEAPAPSRGAGGTLGKFTIPGLRELVRQCAAETGIPVGGEQTPFWAKVNAFVTNAGQNHTIWSVSDLRMAIAQVMRSSSGAGDGGTHWHWEDDWADTDEATYQELILNWDGRAWQSLAAKAIKRVHEGADEMTPAVLLRLAQECPDVTLSAVLGNMARERQAVAA